MTCSPSFVSSSGTAAIEQYPGAMQQLGGASRQNFETVVRSRLGPSEFMLFH